MTCKNCKHLSDKEKYPNKGRTPVYECLNPTDRLKWLNRRFGGTVLKIKWYNACKNFEVRDGNNI